MTWYISSMKTTKKILLKDIAAEAGCSVAVASRALSSDSFQNRTVAKQTAAAVVLAARKLGYTPPRQRGRKRPVGVISVFLPDLSTTLMLKLISGISKVTAEHETPVYFYNRANAASFRNFIRDYLNVNRNLGVISYYPADEADVPDFLDMHRKINQKDGKLVVIHNNAPKDFPAVSIRINNYSGGRMAGEYLGAMDLREYFAIVWPRPDYRHDRMYGFCSALEKRNKNTTVFWGTADQYDQLTTSLNRIYRMVDWNAPGAVGIFCDSDNTALTVNGFFQAHGIVVGKQIKLIGYDDLEQTIHTYPRLTTIHQPFEEMGANAVRKLIRLMKGFPETSEILEPELIVREST